MSFNLPRNQKDLRFTGELRAAIDDQPRSKLGIPRSKKTTPQPGRSALSPDPYAPGTIPTPFAPPPIEVLDFDDDDDSPTTMLDRDGLDVLPGGFGAPRHKPQGPAAGNPVPNFRTPAPMPKVIVAPDSQLRLPRDEHTRTPPLVFWLVAALVLAIVSYKVTPLAFAKAEGAAKRVQTM